MSDAETLNYCWTDTRYLHIINIILKFVANASSLNISSIPERQL